MRVLRLCWLGIATDEYERTRLFFRDVLGLDVAFEESTTTELSLPSGDRVQLFAPGDRYELFRKQAQGLVALFEVDDVRAARSELAAAGIEVSAEIERDDEWEWFHVRAPDGNLYELAARREP